MREILTDLIENMGGVGTVNFLWHIERQDSTDYYFTDADKDITYDSQTYKTLKSGTLSAVNQASQLNPDNFDFSMILDSTEIDEEDVKAGLFDYANVYIYIIDREATTESVVKLLRGILGEARLLDDHKSTIEFRSLTQLLSQGIGRVYGIECDADLGDSRCGVTIATYTETGTLTGVTNNQVFADSSRTEADDYFNYGLLTWTGGNNNGLTMEVKDYDGTNDEFTLASPMPFTVQVGDTYSVYRGCDKTKATCISPYSNVVNHRGFAEIPGIDLIHKIPDVNEDAGLHD